MQTPTIQNLRKTAIVSPLFMGFALLSVMSDFGVTQAFARLFFWLKSDMIYWLICYGFALLICLPILEVLNRTHNLCPHWFILGIVVVLSVPAAWFAMWPTYPPFRFGYSSSFIFWVNDPLSSLDHLDRFIGFLIFWVCCGAFLWIGAGVLTARTAGLRDWIVRKSLATKMILFASVIALVTVIALVGRFENTRNVLFYWSMAHHSSCTSSPPIHRYMMGCGAAKPVINRKNANELSGGECVLGLALYYGHDDIVRELFVNGTDWRRCRGTPVDLVNTWIVRCDQRQTDSDTNNNVLSLVMTETGLKFADLKETLVNAAQYCPDTALYMLKHGTPATGALGKGGVTALHRAVYKRNGSVGLIEALLIAGADVNARTSTGHTPLYLARQWGQPEFVKLLLEHGAKE